MWNEALTTTPFTNPDADDVFYNTISGFDTSHSWNSDTVFLATARALYKDSIGDADGAVDKKLRVTFGRHRASRVSAEMSSVLNVSIETPGIYVFEVLGDDEAVDRGIKSAEEALENTDGFRVVERVELYFKKAFDVRCYVNEERHATVLITAPLTAQRVHLLASGMPVYFPWFPYSKESLGEQRMKVIESLSRGDRDGFLAALESIAAEYDFRTRRIQNCLSGFEHRLEERFADDVRERLAELRRDIERYQDHLYGLYSQKAEKEATLYGFMNKINTDTENEVMEFFIRSKNLVLISSSGLDITFVVNDYVDYFDEDLARSAIENDMSVLYRPNGRACNNIIPADDMKLLMTAVFLDRKVRMRTCAAYQFSNTEVRGLTDFSFGYQSAGRFPNTHIDRYHCLGDYAPQINSCLVERDYIGALNACIASCRSLNFGDHCVMEAWWTRFYGLTGITYDTQCFELPDKSVVGAKEAIEWLKKGEQ